MEGSVKALKELVFRAFRNRLFNIKLCEKKIELCWRQKCDYFAKSFSVKVIDRDKPVERRLVISFRLFDFWSREKKDANKTHHVSAQEIDHHRRC